MTCCKDCEYWEEINLCDQGECRRLPPDSRRSTRDGGEAQPWHPRTYEEHWCGEFNRRPYSEEEMKTLKELGLAPYPWSPVPKKKEIPDEDT